MARERSPILALLAFALVALCPLWLPKLPPEGFWVARGLALAGCAWVALTVVAPRGRLPLPASPAFLLPFMALILYSVLPAIFVQIEFGGPATLPLEQGPAVVRADQTGVALFPRYAAASAGEAMVLGFAGTGLLVALAFDRLMSAGGFVAFERGPPVALPLALILGAGLVFQAGKAALPLFASPALASAVDLLPPVAMFGMALLTMGCLEGRPQWAAWTVVGLIVGGALFFPYQFKSWSLMAGAAVVTWVFISRGRARLGAFILLAAAPIAAVSVVQSFRNIITPHRDGIQAVIVDFVVPKLVLRQSETVFCLNYALREAAAGGGEWRAGPLYFTAGLVPRLLWPEKPSLSHGGLFSRTFCGVDGSSGHSASITLIGEPVVRAGGPGLVAAGLTLAGISALVTAALKRGGRFTAAGAMAMAPWLIDFDPHLSMYLANAGKALFAISIAAVALYAAWRLFSRPFAEGGG